MLIFYCQKCATFLWHVFLRLRNLSSETFPTPTVRFRSGPYAAEAIDVHFIFNSSDPICSLSCDLWAPICVRIARNDGKAGDPSSESFIWWPTPHHSDVNALKNKNGTGMTGRSTFVLAVGVRQAPIWSYLMEVILKSSVGICHFLLVSECQLPDLRLRQPRFSLLSRWSSLFCFFGVFQLIFKLSQRIGKWYFT